MFDNLKCRLGFHKPTQYHQTFKHKCRTTNKGRSKKRWRTWIREIVTVTYCERCGKTLREAREYLSIAGENAYIIDNVTKQKIKEL